MAAGHYVVCFDPLDGSSNIDAGISTGSIFGQFLPLQNYQVYLANTSAYRLSQNGMCLKLSHFTKLLDAGQGRRILIIGSIQIVSSQRLLPKKTSS